MRSTERPGACDVVAFLRRLRSYRGTLPWLDKALLDSLVAAGLGRASPPQSDEQIESVWAAYAAGPGGGTPGAGEGPSGDPADWHSTPWGKTYATRYR